MNSKMRSGLGGAAQLNADNTRVQVVVLRHFLLRYKFEGNEDLMLALLGHSDGVLLQEGVLQATVLFLIWCIQSLQTIGFI